MQPHAQESKTRSGSIALPSHLLPLLHHTACDVFCEGTLCLRLNVKQTMLSTIFITLTHVQNYDLIKAKFPAGLCYGVVRCPNDWLRRQDASGSASTREPNSINSQEIVELLCAEADSCESETLDDKCQRL